MGGSGGSGNSAADKHKQMLNDYYASLLGRQAPQMGPASQAGYSGFRQNQSNLISHLEALSNGQGPSLAMAQLQAATDKNVASQQALAASGRGGPLASAQAANNTMRTGAQASQDSVAARIQEEQMALAMLGQNINAGRGSDEGINTFNAGQQNQVGIANLEARLRAMGMNDQAIQAVMSGMMDQSKVPQLGDKILAGGSSALAMKYGMGNGQNNGGGGGYTQPGYINQDSSTQNWQGSTPWNDQNRHG